MYCTTANPTKAELKSHYTEEFFRSAQEKDSGETIYVELRWVVLYSNSEQKVPIERIRSCHQTLNDIYGGRNTDELAKVPNTLHNPWQPKIGLPNIQFLPLDSSKVTAEYIVTNSPLNATSPVNDAAQRGKQIKGVLNIYVGNSGSGGILGQAELSSNIVYILHSAVGGVAVNGTLGSYHLGKTLAHEIGHALSLPHTFSDDVCDGDKPFIDIPESIRPNFQTQFVQQGGVWELVGDNRDKDRKNNFATKLSCLYFESQGGSVEAPNDMGCNIMDYGDDNVSVMFSKGQVALMRAFLQNPEVNTMIELKTADTTVTAATTTTTTSENDLTEPSSDPVVETSYVWLYVLVAVLGCLFLGGMIWLYYHYHRNPTRTRSTSMVL
jgi:hypothetical protein